MKACFGGHIFWIKKCSIFVLSELLLGEINFSSIRIGCIMEPQELDLSTNTQKALSVQLGKDAGTEIAMLLRKMAAQIDELKRTKVTVTSVVPVTENSDSVWNFV